MKQELQDKLFEKYPKIFRQKDLPMQQTAMCWGVCCGDGWYNIIDTLCHNIQTHVVSRGEGGVEATQVKEKYGGLRFYYTGGDSFIRGLCLMAEGLSCRTCEECGSPGTQNGKGWINTLCDPCRENLTEIRRKRVTAAQERVIEDHKTAFESLSENEDSVNDWECTPSGEHNG